MALESYLRVRTGETDPIDIQRQLADLGGYIGSYVVELDEEADFSFDILVGFQAKTEDDLAAAVTQVKDLVGEENVREFRNRKEVPPSIGAPGQLGQY
jgi:hypothetical protein